MSSLHPGGIGLLQRRLIKEATSGMTPTWKTITPCTAGHDGPVRLHNSSLAWVDPWMLPCLSKLLGVCHNLICSFSILGRMCEEMPLFPQNPVSSSYLSDTSDP